MDAETESYLRALRGHPEGDVTRWRQRYAPLIAERRALRVVKTPRVCVVIVAWRADPALCEALACVARQRGVARREVQLVLVDNAGPGGLDALRACIAEQVDLHLVMRGNTGPSLARNAGAAYATAPLLCFLDDDGLIKPDYLTRALDYFDGDDRLIALRARIKAHKHPYFTTLAGHYDRGPEPLEDGLITEGSMVIRREAYLQVGGFNDELYGHEGIDLTYRLTQRYPRSKILYAPDVVMRHDYLHSWGKFIAKHTRHATLDAPDHKREPDLQRFMDAFFARSFPRAKLPPDERLARAILRLIRRLLYALAKR